MEKRELSAYLIIVSMLILSSFNVSSALEYHEDSYPKFTLGEKAVIDYVEICVVKEDNYLCRTVGTFQNEELGIDCTYDLFGQKNSYADDADIAEFDFRCIVEKKYDVLCPVSMNLGSWPKRILTDENDIELTGKIEESSPVGIMGEGRGIVFIKPERYHFRIEDLESGVTFRLCSNKAPPGQYDANFIFVPISTEISKAGLHDPIKDVEHPPDTLSIVSESAVNSDNLKETSSEGERGGLMGLIRRYWIWLFVALLFAAFLHVFKKPRTTHKKDDDLGKS